MSDLSNNLIFLSDYINKKKSHKSDNKNKSKNTKYQTKDLAQIYYMKNYIDFKNTRLTSSDVQAQSQNKQASNILLFSKFKNSQTKTNFKKTSLNSESSNKISLNAYQKQASFNKLTSQVLSYGAIAACCLFAFTMFFSQKSNRSIASPHAAQYEQNHNSWLQKTRSIDLLNTHFILGNKSSFKK